MYSSYARNAIVLGLLSAVGPFAIDMYLPALPAIGVDLGASPAAVQLSVLALFAAVGLCQVIYGPISDMYGRRAPLFVGMVLYTLGAIGCALAVNIEMLIAMRFLQGVGACAGMTIPRAVVRDLHTGPSAARLLSLIMLVFSISPMLAPLSGSIVNALIGWRAIFWTLSVFGVLGFLLALFALPETRPAESRLKSNWRSAIGNYAVLLRDRRFVGVTLIGGFGMAAFFSYLVGAAFLFIQHFGLSEIEFALVFASNALAFIGMAQLNWWAGRRFGLDRVVLTAATGFAGLTIILFGITALGGESLPVIWAMLFASFGCLGLVIPSSAVLAMDDHGPIAGTASSLLGTIQMLVGATITIAVSLFADGSAVPMIVGIAVCGSLVAIMAWTTLRGRRPELPALAE